MQSFGKNSEKGKIELKTDLYSTDLKFINSQSIAIKNKTYAANSYIDEQNGINYTLIRSNTNYFSIVKFDAKKFITSKTEGEYSEKASMEKCK